MKLPKAYEPSAHENTIYELWEKNNAFTPTGKGQPYSIVIPPPNANGNLHIGHALTFGLEDVAARYHRLKGDNVLLLPGADHAGFETWVVYEKQLAKVGKSRFDYSREELYQQVWDFVAKNRTQFEDQLRRLGLSADWSKYTFTLDKKIVERAYKTFKKMWSEKLIYRGERLVNFCTFHGTAFADIEVDHKNEKGSLWYIKYPLTDGSGSLTVATTRPETMLGDTAVAVHPNDKRYSKYVGKTIKLPLTKREIPIIADDFVDPKYGTGAVKITPAHDPNDFEAGQRHDLPQITVINHEGLMSDETPQEYRSREVLEARKLIVKDLDGLGLLEKTETIEHSVGHCYKCNTVIQPLLREQWFIDMEPLAKATIDTLKSNKITFYPDAKKKQLIEYLESLKDWNISRQIAWGIPIPAFQNIDDSDDWIFDDRVGEEYISLDGKKYRRDPDVFDTWFSSSSWPYATLGYPDNSDFKDFYPLSVMETGGEILYPWVSRMIMLGLYVTDEIPFDSVYVHGYVMAEDGAKMSKSIGNVINPIEVIDKYGSDALRIGIIAGRAPAVNRGYDHRKVEDARNFCNKLWNIARFIEAVVATEQVGNEFEAKTLQDNWILERLSKTANNVARSLEEYNFSEAYESIYHFVWDDLADWYIESSKVSLNSEVLVKCLKDSLIIAHPFAPFVTETLWQKLKLGNGSLLIKEAWPTIDFTDTKSQKMFEEVKKIVTETRFLMKETGVKKATLTLENAQLFECADLIRRLSGASEVLVGSKPEKSLQLISTSSKAWLTIDIGLIGNYLDKLKLKNSEQTEVIARLEGRLNNKNYVENAPNSIVEETKKQLALAKKLAGDIASEIDRYKELS